MVDVIKPVPELVELIRRQIGAEQSQEKFLESKDWQETIDEEINKLSNVELLYRIQYALEKLGVLK
jgi:hypothetical protein